MSRQGVRQQGFLISQHSFGVATRRIASLVGFVSRHDLGCRDNDSSVGDGSLSQHSFLCHDRVWLFGVATRPGL